MDFLDAQQSYLSAVVAMSAPQTMKQASPITVSAPTSSPKCDNGVASPSVGFTVKIPQDKNAIIVNLPIADSPGNWTLHFDQTKDISFWQVDAGKPPSIPVINDNKPPTNNQIQWSVPDGQPTTDTRLSLQFLNGGVNINCNINGKQKCSVRNAAGTNVVSLGAFSGADISADSRSRT
jgi:hypothetical protein